MKKIFTTGLAMLAFIFANSQVGINTTTPNGATVLDIHSNEKGILVPRLSDTERDTKLADNDPATVPPTGVVNSNLTSGTLIFNTTANRFEFWDGLLWRQLFVATSSQAGNDGVVKINGSGVAGTKPVLSLSSNGNTYGPRKQVIYQVPLKFADPPTTSWPETVPGYNDINIDKTPYIYYVDPNNANNIRFKENAIPGQVHLWRLMTTVTAGSNSSGSLKATFLNPDSGFEVNSISILPSGSSGVPKPLTFYFYTIADQESIPNGRGYQVFLEADQSVSVVVESFTRVSLFKD